MQSWTVEERRVFLDAAAIGNLDIVDGWIANGGDVNVTVGEGWSALFYAVAHSRMNVVRKLLENDKLDLNATTIPGSSALTLALARKNNSLVELLLRSGASRATIPMKILKECDTAAWMNPEVKQMLRPDWAVVWTPRLHRHFSPVEREKCRLVVYANMLALRQLGTQTFGDASLLSQFGWKVEGIERFWRSTTSSPVRWRYFAQPLIYHIIEYAVFLW
ncbi:Ankyrin [Plasmopara halstedii]|uniref:Ankyrin n=1 Tax=Plasmopara halstedii TaxID=4781 RepID=A0A0P1B5W9_PLAHL|nr:Ankyrin [Plasmopara halstedii]CEG48911.1 Ankyrin [Plasmopara halstedii]|eukprot:XP_024585280.1 Ankyrin [Plasmopara halstedii]